MFKQMVVKLRLIDILMLTVDTLGRLVSIGLVVSFLRRFSQVSRVSTQMRQMRLDWTSNTLARWPRADSISAISSTSLQLYALIRRLRANETIRSRRDIIIVQWH